MSKNLDDLVPKRTDGKRSKLPHGNRPLKNLISSEEMKRQMRKLIRDNPQLGKDLTPEQKKLFDIKE